MNTKTKIKQYLDANVHDGEDRKGCHCDKAVFTPDELQELVEEACEYALKEEKPKTIDFAQLPVDTLVSFRGDICYMVRIGNRGVDVSYSPKITAKYSDINCNIDGKHEDLTLVKGRKVVWEGGECPLPDGVEVVVGLSDGKTVTNVCTYFNWSHSGDIHKIIWYQITGRIV